MAKGDDPIEAARDRLYRAPLGDFMALRKALVADLRARGEKAAAAEIAAVNKPAPTAWAVNQVALDHAGEIGALLDAIEALRTAHSRAKGPQFAEARAALNERASTVLQRVRGVMEKAGHAWSPEAQRRVARTLHALPFVSAEEVARLRAGRLVKDLDVAADFGALAASVGEGPAKGAEKAEAAAAEEEAREAAPAKAPRAAREARDAARAKAEALAAKARAREEARRQREEEAARQAAERARRKALEAQARAAETEAQRLEAEAERLEAEAARAANVAKKARAEAEAAKRAARGE